MQEEMMNQIEFAVHYGAARRRYVCTSCMISRVAALEGITSISTHERANGSTNIAYTAEGVVMIRPTIITGDCNDCVLMECVAPRTTDAEHWVPSYEDSFFEQETSYENSFFEEETGLTRYIWD
jgi:hypothetical protein